MGSIGRHRKNNRSREMKNGSRANVSHFRMGANGIRDSIINLSSTDFGQNFRPAEVCCMPYPQDLCMAHLGTTGGMSHPQDLCMAYLGII